MGAISLAPLHYLALTGAYLVQMRLCSLRRTTGSDVYRITTGKMPTMQQSAFGSHPFGGSLAASVREEPLQVRFNPCFCWALRTIVCRLLASDLRRGWVHFGNPSYDHPRAP
jgi:hypothetical protein